MRRSPLLVVIGVAMLACSRTGAKYADAVAADDARPQEPGRQDAAGPDIQPLDAPAADALDAATPIGGCEHLGACACLAASDTCAPVSTPCWCAACDPAIVCICGGGTFRGCQPNTCAAVSCGLGASRSRDPAGCISCDPAPDCATALGRVQTNCGGPFIADISDLCATNPTCIAACLAGLAACDQVNCRFCKTCDCAAGPTPFSSCVDACRAP